MSASAPLNVGSQIRLMRERRALSLRALAELSGLSINAISLIERGENSPTVSSLHQLATALGVSITRFFEDDQELAVVYTRPATRLQTAASGVVMESLGIGLRHQQIEPFLLRVSPGSGNLTQPITHSGEEFVYCQEGRVDYVVAGEAFDLTAGCSLLFQSTQPHCFHNSGDAPAVLIMIFRAGAAGHLIRQLHLSAHQQSEVHDADH